MGGEGLCQIGIGARNGPPQKRKKCLFSITGAEIEWNAPRHPRDAAGDLPRSVSVISFYQGCFGFVKSGDFVQCPSEMVWVDTRLSYFLTLCRHTFWPKNVQHILFCGPVEFYFPRGELIRPRLSGWATERAASQKNDAQPKKNFDCFFRLPCGLVDEMWHTSPSFSHCIWLRTALGGIYDLTKLHEIRSGPGKAGDFPNLTLTHLGSLQLGDLDGRAGISPQNLTCV